MKPLMKITARQPGGKTIEFEATALIETPLELDYYRSGGLARKILQDMQ